MTRRILPLVLLLSLTLPAFTCFADAVVDDWTGHWDFNLDGRACKFDISKTAGKDADASPAHGLQVKFTDADGHDCAVRVNRLDENFQHLSFTVKFGQDPQTFDAYIFSWDKTKLAGITGYHDRPFGFSAEKKVQKGK